MTKNKTSALTKPQLKFLNSEACQQVSPYNKKFWPKLTAWLTSASKQAEGLPKAQNYRCALEPYLLQRVYMLARTWEIKEISEDNERFRLLLRDVCLTHARGDSIGVTPNVVIDHMNIWVSSHWLNSVIPADNDPLVLNGVLYEYANAKQTRNIGIMPVLVMPRSRKLGARWKNCAACPDIPLCPGLAA